METVLDPITTLDWEEGEERAVPCQMLFCRGKDPALYRVFFEPLACSHRSFTACTSCKDATMEYVARRAQFNHGPCTPAPLRFIRIDPL